MRDLGLTADIRRVSTDYALAWHLLDLSKKCALRLWVQVRFRLFQRHNGMDCTGTALVLPPRRKRPESEERAEASRSHSLLVQRKRRRAPCREHDIHAAGQIA